MYVFLYIVLSKRTINMAYKGKKIKKIPNNDQFKF